ncbi:hypothetical protein QVD17_12872 [Tagetes erecta]|uniref:non-specific serine/threonine protein kinase n=1 Tax=Tagetes erecta TaxID=13708 RepID=A0AAD8KZX6_TARER|nr:hypothetical protein QVD17_12872 [Tagetes erecta]
MSGFRSCWDQFFARRWLIREIELLLLRIVVGLKYVEEFVSPAAPRIHLSYGETEDDIDHKLTNEILLQDSKVQELRLSIDYNDNTGISIYSKIPRTDHSMSSKVSMIDYDILSNGILTEDSEWENKKDCRKISLEIIKLATQNFHNDNMIGGGGFGKVFKGKLQDGDDVVKIIIAKRLDAKFGQGELQFLSELQILLKYKHENIIGLVGYCDENDEKIIVYEYASKGSLDRYLNDPFLTWVKRLNICIDIASALDFLHGGVGKQAKVIHRDIKTSNILLNEDWRAKLADFGLSTITPLNQDIDYVINHACGTPGYIDPLYKSSGFLTIDSDIYSFGVVMFEILCGKSTFGIKKHEGHYLPDFIKTNFEEGKHDKVVFVEADFPADLSLRPMLL